MDDDVFALLDREWHTLTQSPRTRRAFRQWSEPTGLFAASGCVHHAMEVAKGATPLQHRYDMTAALLKQARNCALAERTMLQAHIPAAYSLSRKARGWTAERLSVSYGLVTEIRDGRVSTATWPDLDAIAIAGAAEWIRNHAGEDQPLAGLKLRDHARNRLRAFVWADLRRSNAEHIAQIEWAEPERNASAELIELLHQAQNQNVLTQDEIDVIAGNRLLGVTDRQFGRKRFVSAATANRIRARIEARLALAVV